MDSETKKRYTFPSGVKSESVNYVLALQSQLSFLARRKVGLVSYLGRKILNLVKIVNQEQTRADFKEVEYEITDDLFSEEHKPVRKNVKNTITSKHLLFESFDDVQTYMKNN